jgi:hypothetical protein
VRGDSAPDADAFAVFVELDLVISTPIQRSRHSFGVGRLFMPADFSKKYQQTNPREMRDVTLSVVAHLALGEGVAEHLKRRSKPSLPSERGRLNLPKRRASDNDLGRLWLPNQL